MGTDLTKTTGQALLLLVLVVSILGFRLKCEGGVPFCEIVRLGQPFDNKLIRPKPAQKNPQFFHGIKIANKGIESGVENLMGAEVLPCQGEEPVLEDDFYTTCPGLPFTERVTYNDSNLQSPVFSIFRMPKSGSVSIDATGKFLYTPFTTDCMRDTFTYKVCKDMTACCDTAIVVLEMGDNTPPVLMNVPADLTINCDELVPAPQTVNGFDSCPGVVIEFDETSWQDSAGICKTYNIIRTWTATDLCGNSSSGSQTITVEDNTEPELFRLYTLPNGSKLVAGVSKRTTQNWKYISFPTAFSQTPLLFTQIVSAAEASAVVVRQRNASKQGFEMRLCEEEAGDGTHLPEMVAWLAIEPGTVNDSFQLIAGQLTNVSHMSKALPFVPPFTETPGLLATVQTNLENDPLTLRFQTLTAGGVNLFLQEETSKDPEMEHAPETVGYLAFEQNLVLTDQGGDFIGETGQLTLTNNWMSVVLNHRYTKPVVIFGGMTYNDTAPATLRVRNVTANSFEVRVEEWNYLDGNHGDEKLSYLVLEGSIPFDPANYCAANPASLQAGVNLFVRDNCDAQTALDYQDSIVLQPGLGLLKTQTWTAVDNCGNQLVVSRYDTCSIAAVRLKAFLYGALIGTSPGSFLMRDDLRKKGQLPMVEPYANLEGFQHKGSGGGETAVPAAFLEMGNQTVVDWVFVELRDPLNSKVVLATQSALLLRNGDVISAAGDSVLYFYAEAERDYFVALRHRNHLGIITDTPCYLSSANPPLVDFTNPAVPIQGGMEGARLFDGKRALWPGDLSGDGKVIFQGPSNDVFNLFSRVVADPGNTGFLANFIVSGYDRNDLNMDGKVIYQGPNNDQSFMLFQTVLSHPENIAKLANFIVAEKLP